MHLWDWAITLIIIVFLFQIVCAMARKNQSKRLLSLECALVTVSTGLLGFYTIPSIADDLYRYNAEMDMMRQYGLTYALRDGVWKDTVISNLLLYITSQTGCYQIIPFVSVAGIVLLFYAIMKSCVDDSKGTINIFVLILIEFFFGAFLGIYESISGVRFTFGIIASLIVVYADVTEKIKRPIWIILLYALLPFVHTSMILVCVVVLLTRFVPNAKIRYLLMLLSPLLVGIIIFVFLNSGINILQSIAGKAEMYQGTYSTGTSSVQMITSFTVTFLMLVVVHSAYAQSKKIQVASPNIAGNRKLYEYAMGCSIMTMAIYPVTQSLFFRFFLFVFLLETPALYYYLSQGKSKYKYIVIFGLGICACIKWFYQWMNYFQNWVFG